MGVQGLKHNISLGEDNVVCQSVLLMSFLSFLGRGGQVELNWSIKKNKQKPQHIQTGLHRIDKKQKKKKKIPTHPV